MKSFEERLQLSVGAKYPLEMILSNLSADEIKEEVRLYAIEVAKETQQNIAYAVRDLGAVFRSEVLASEILSESNIPKL